MFIVLTGHRLEKSVRFNINQIVDYGLTSEDATYITTTHLNGGFIIVKETPEQIDALIKALPNHPEVLSLEDINDGN